MQPHAADAAPDAPAPAFGTPLDEAGVAALLRDAGLDAVLGRRVVRCPARGLPEAIETVSSEVRGDVPSSVSEPVFEGATATLARRAATIG